MLFNAIVSALHRESGASMLSVNSTSLWIWPSIFDL
jgi:hypothetical protein